MTRSARDDNAAPSGTRKTRLCSQRSNDSFGDIER